MACADVTSANTVGYLTKNLETGFNPIGASFVTVGSQGMKLSQFVPTGLGEKSTAEVSIQILNNFGTTTNTYSYYKGQTGRGAKADGWWCGNTQITTENDVIFEPGQGLWVVGVTGYGLQTSGEVLFDDVVIPLNQGFKLISNPYPMPIKLTNLTPGGISDKSTAEVSIQILNNFGTTTNTFSFYQGQTGRGAKADGWWNGNTQITTDNDAVFPVGQALWVVGIEGSSLKFSLGDDNPNK